jgi:hypothetical protein
MGKIKIKKVKKDSLFKVILLCFFLLLCFQISFAFDFQDKISQFSNNLYYQTAGVIDIFKDYFSWLKEKITLPFKGIFKKEKEIQTTPQIPPPAPLPLPPKIEKHETEIEKPKTPSLPKENPKTPSQTILLEKPQNSSLFEKLTLRISSLERKISELTEKIFSLEKEPKLKIEIPSLPSSLIIQVDEKIKERLNALERNFEKFQFATQRSFENLPTYFSLPSQPSFVSFFLKVQPFANYAIRVINDNFEPLLFLSKEGRLGIGTESPREKLEVSGNILGRGNLIVLGKVGVGTTTPAFSLDVNGNLRTTGSLRVEGNFTVLGTQTFSGSVSFEASSTSPALIVIQNGIGDIASFKKGTEEVFKIDNLGNILGTRNLTIQGTSTLATTTLSRLTITELTPGSVLFAGAGGLIFQDNSNLFWDNTNKRLGIGTPNPSQKLDVQGGNINASGSLMTGGVVRIDSSGNLTNIGTISSTYLVTDASYVNLINSAELRVGGITVLTSGRALQNLTGIVSSGTIQFTGLTANRLVTTDGSKNLVSSITADNLRASVSGTTGTGDLVFGTSPSISSPTLSGTISGTYTIGGAPTLVSSLTGSGSPNITGIGLLSATNLAISGTATTTNLNVTGLTNLATTTISTQLAVPKIVTLAGNLTINPAGNLVISKSTSISGDLLVSGTATTTQLVVTSTSTLGTVISGIWQGSVISTKYGGTGNDWSTQPAGSLPYFSDTGILSTLPIGVQNTVLISSGTLPQWSSSLNLAGTLAVSGTSTLATTTLSRLTITELTPGSVLFAGAGGLIFQDNSNLFWDNTNKRLGIGTPNPSQKLDVQGGNINASGSLMTGGVVRIDSSGNLTNIGTISSTYLVTDASYVNLINSAELRVGGITVLTSGRALQNLTGIVSSGTIQFTGLTANRLVTTDGSKNLVSSITADNLRASVSGTTGTGDLVFGTSPSISSPTLSGTISGTYTIGGAPTLVSSLTGSGSPNITGIGLLSATNLAISGTATTTNLNVTGLTNLATTTISTQLAVPKIVTLAGNLTINPAGNLVISKSTSISGDLLVSGTATTTQLVVTSTSTLGTVISGIWQGSVISTKYGGTGNDWSTQPAGSLPYFSDTGILSTLPIGVQNTVLISSGTLPQWSSSLNLAGTLAVSGTSTLATTTLSRLTITELTPGSVLFAGAGGLIFQNNSNLFWDNTNKRLGIGTSTPAGILHVATGTVNALVIDTSGNVGIGTTAPSAKLDVQDSGTGPQFDIRSGYGRIKLFPGWNDNWAYFESGNLTWNGNINGLKITGYNVNPLNNLHLLANTIYASGNVGIGTVSPSEKLEVAGNIKFTGNYLKTNVLNQIVPIYIRGTGLNNNANRVLKIGSNTIYDASGRGLRLTVLNKSDLSIALDATYDTYGSATDSDNLANALNSITKDQIGILTSWDAWENAVTTNLKNAFQRCGLYKALMTPQGARRPYAAIFECSSSTTVGTAKAAEVLFSNDANTPYAEIRGWLIDGSFVVSGDVPNALSNNIGTTPVILVNEFGNVGIGTTSPAGQLDVSGSFYTRTGEILLRPQNTTYEGGQITFYGAGSYDTWFHDVWQNSMRFFTNSANTNQVQMFNVGTGSVGLYVQGNVGIGTTAPSAKLHVMSAGESIYFGSGAISYPTTPSAGLGNLVGKGGASDFRIAIQDGTGRLNMYWNAYYDSSAFAHKYIVSNEGANRLLMTSGNFGFYVAPAGTAGDNISWTNAMYITSSGNVSIGPTAPNQKLTVAGGSMSFISGGLSNPTVAFGTTQAASLAELLGFYVYDTSSGYQGWAGAIGVGGEAGGWGAKTLRIQVPDGSGNVIDALTIKGGSGNVGIGTTMPQMTLHVKSTYTTAGVRVDAPSNQQVGYQWAKDESVKWSAYIDVNSNDLRFWDGTNNRVTFASGGNVGIGTTAPGAKLDVAGTIRSQDVFAAGGQNLIIGDDTFLTDIDTANTLGIYGLQDSTQAHIKLGSNGPIISGYNGNVGIGTTAPTYKLVVVGIGAATGGWITVGPDIAENYPTYDLSIEAGDIVAPDPQNPKFIVKTSQSYQNSLIGVISTNPGFIMTGNDDFFTSGKISKDNERLVALAGRVPVKVSTENGEIKVGDLLTSSSKPGVAMKATELGRVIGIALEPYNGEGIGKIMIFVNPHWFLGQISEEGLIYTEEEIRQKEIQPASILDQFTLAIKKSLEKLGLILQGRIAKIEKLLTKEIETEEITPKKICSKSGKCVEVTDELIEKLNDLTTHNLQQTTSNQATNNETMSNEQSNSEQQTANNGTANNQPTVNFLNLPYSGKVGQEIEFSATTSNFATDTLIFNWNFGDGNSTTTNTPSVSHTYNATDTFTLILSVQGGDKSASASATVEIKE